jgi:hypothetical protein
MPETKAALRRFWFWTRMWFAGRLYGWAIRIAPAEGLLWTLGYDVDLPEWTKPIR